MRLTKDEIRELLRENGLRVTAPRVAVVGVLSEAEVPLSHTEVVQRLGDTDWDPATVYRNLVKLREAGIAPVASSDPLSELLSEGDVSPRALVRALQTRSPERNRRAGYRLPAARRASR